jgi:excisionase family DNA binding protein
MTPDPEWLTVKEYAALRRVHVETVKRWIRAKLIEAERVGRNVSTRVFVVGAEAVVVEHERGIRLVPVEAKG